MASGYCEALFGTLKGDKATSELSYIADGDENTFSGSDDEEINNEKQHSKMLEAIASLEGRQNIIQRSEPSISVSEFTLSKVGKQKVKVHELLSSLKQTSSHVTLKQQLRTVAKRNKLLHVPLPAPQAEKIKRSVAYEKVSKEVKKWDNVVINNRLAEQIVFPLKQPDFRLETANEVTKRFKLTTPLETEVAQLLNESENVMTQDKELTAAEEKVLKAMSLEEAFERHRELQKMRALLSFQEAKARRQNKIKSKRFHRILKKERLRKELKDFEDLQKTNPKLAQEKLNQLDRYRIQERLTLKHRNTGKWAKHQMIRAKYNPQSREAVKEQLSLGQQLLQKKGDVLYSDGEDCAEVKDAVLGSESQLENDSFLATYNPWMKTLITNNANVKTSDENETNSKGTVSNEDFISLHGNSEKIENVNDEVKILCTSPVQSSGGKLKNSIKNAKGSGDAGQINTKKKVKTKRIAKKKLSNSHRDIDEIFDELHSPKGQMETTSSHIKLKMHTIPVVSEKENGLNSKTDDTGITHDSEVQLTESLNRKQTWEDFENMDAVEENVTMSNEDLSKKIQGITHNSNKDGDLKTDSSNISVNPSDFVSVETKMLKSQIPDIVEKGDDDDDGSDDDHRMTIEEAFADDDVVSEFKESKKLTIERDKPQDIDLFLPGWGSWGGAGIKPSKKKRRKFLIKAPSLPRKDQNLGGVIISEKEEKLAAHQVSELPFPFTSVQQFESSIRQPIGNTWNPETAFQKLIAPKVITKLGKIIDPIDNDAILTKKPPQHKVKRRKKLKNNVPKKKESHDFLAV